MGRISVPFFLPLLPLMKQLTVLIFLFVYTSVGAQISMGYDTLDINNRIFGKLDSVDIKSGDLPTTSELGRSFRSENGLSGKLLKADFNELTGTNFSKYNPMQFSALPYLGFSYSFGSQGAQFLRAKYRQAFSDSFLLNIDYKRNSGVGYIRNAAFQSNNVQLQLERKGKRYSFQIKGMYENDSLNHSNGLVPGGDTLIEAFGLDLIPVRRTASSNHMRGQIALKNYINILNDSLRQFGLTTGHEYRIQHRRFLEADTLWGIYDTIYIDSFSTVNRFNQAQIANDAGVYWLNEQLYVDAKVGVNYWNVLNLDNIFDTTEIYLSSNLTWKRKTWSVKNSFYFNVVGRFNEWKNNFNFGYSFRDWNLTGGLILENMAPTAIQRAYSGNAYRYRSNIDRLQNNTTINGAISNELIKDKLSVKAFVFNSLLTNQILFNDSTWVQTSDVNNILQIGIKGKSRFGVLHFNPTFIFSSDTYGYLPTTQAYARVFVKGKLFEAKKMEAFIGGDFSYQSSFNLRTYNPIMNTFNWFNDGGSISSTVNAHAFMGFQIETFRFYARFENIGYFWTEPTLNELQNYPIAGTRIRVGITWDFFN